MNSHNQAYTILRIKRKRNEEPLDALVVESGVRRKKSRGGIDVFQFAQTVEQDAWEDERLHQNLQSQISKLAQEPSENLVPKDTTAPEKISVPAASPRPQSTDDRRYTILPVAEEDNGRRRAPTSPPKVISWRDVPPKSDFKMYDAVLAASSNSPTADAEMESFLPMLNEYLSLQDITASSSQASVNTPPDTSKGDDYVWDVFYRRPATLNEWVAAANVGTLTGLPPSLTDPYDSDTDSEEEDEADEDSNAEEYYKNDYPDDEEDSDGSDMFHEHSEGSDVDYDAPDDEEHEWR
ncbi:hypothetical protein BJ138DRAFT_1146173 [Hygrophoropsis aurantiaca]|uniref:Uncharacterized protein n=1 Tax=Hygrophoropsis aurantiaca TaxID=72124 RepID=A0ACB8AIZ6_9AGAM|nr:hypothetical protein BJ138DRAFT_1146173 [Hygrophoropsis aurantiaca]